MPDCERVAVSTFIVKELERSERFEWTAGVETDALRDVNHPARILYISCRFHLPILDFILDSGGAKARKKSQATGMSLKACTEVALPVWEHQWWLSM
jgi:hypothetical protein